MQQPLRIFVSHSHADNEWCVTFVDVLRRLGADVWYDEQNLRRGTLWKVIDREMEARKVFVVVFSPDAFESNWVDLEISSALQLQAQDRDRVILPVVARKCRVPPFLSGLTHVGKEEVGLTPEAAAELVAQALDLPPLTTPVAAHDDVPKSPSAPDDAAAPPASTPGVAPAVAVSDAAYDVPVDTPPAQPPHPLAPERDASGRQPSFLRDVVTNLYDEERRTFLVQYPTWLVVGLTVAGILAFLLTGFFGYRDSREAALTGAIFREPWPLYLWLCALLIVLEVSVLRARRLRGLMAAVLGVTLLGIFLFGVVYYYNRDVVAYLLGPISTFADVRLPAIGEHPLTYAIIDFGVLGLFGASSLVRWIERVRGGLPSPFTTARSSTERDAFLPSLQAIVAGDLLAGAVLALLLAALLQPAIINGLAAAVQSPVHANACTVALPLGPCTTAGGQPSAPSLNVVDLLIAVVLFEHALFIFGLTIGSEGPKAILAVLRSGLNRRVRVPLTSPALQARHFIWPVLILLSVLGAASASRSIQNYLHLQSDIRTCHDAASCGDPVLYQSVHAALISNQQYVALGSAVLWLIVTMIALAFGLAVLLFYWRVAENLLRFLGLVGFILLLTLWIFSLSLSGINALLSLVGLSQRVPFPQPEPVTVVSFASLLAFGGLVIARRMRRPE